MRSKRRPCFKSVSSGGKTKVKTHTPRLVGSKLKVETFKTSEIFQVREESERSRRGATMTVRSSIVKDIRKTGP
jgi:hypothetical protein